MLRDSVGVLISRINLIFILDNLFLVNFLTIKKDKHYSCMHLFSGSILSL